MFWLKKSAPSEPLAVSMSGVKLGDRLLIVGCTDPLLVAQLASKTGLTGRACAVDDDAQRVLSAALAIKREGALVETFTAPPTTLPFESDSFDIVVLRNVIGAIDEQRRAAAASEVHRVLRPGGRALAIDGVARGGLRALFGMRTVRTEHASSAGAEGALTSGGFRAVRQLAERDGLLFVEGIKQTKN